MGTSHAVSKALIIILFWIIYQIAFNLFEVEMERRKITETNTNERIVNPDKCVYLNTSSVKWEYLAFTNVGWLMSNEAVGVAFTVNLIVVETSSG